MRKFIALWAGAMMLAAQPASAQTFTPAGTYILSGPVVYKNAFAGSCTMKITLTVPATPSSTANASPEFLAGIAMCSATFFGSHPVYGGVPYVVSFDPSTSTLSLNNVLIKGGPLGNGCGGTLTGTWDNVSKKLTFNTTLPGTGGSTNCIIQGILTGPAGLSIS